MADNFHIAAIPEPVSLMGFRLRPFSLGHVILLGRVRSSFVTAGETSSLNDLALSVLLCALPYALGIEVLQGDGLDLFFKQWHDLLSGISWATRFRLRKPRRIDYAEIAAKFGEYISDGSKIPNYSFTPGDFAEMACPSVQIVKVTLMRDMGFDEAELMDRPWGLCLWDFVTLRALAGTIRMVDSDKLIEARELADALEEKLRAKGGACPS